VREARLQRAAVRRTGRNAAVSGWDDGEMSDAPLDNPAGRLHRILSQVHDAPPNADIRSTFPKILGVEGASESEFLRAVVDFLDLIPAAEEEVRAVADTNHDLFLTWVEPTREIPRWFSNSAHNMATLQGILKHEHLTALRFAADLLQTRRPQPEIDEEKLPELVDLVRRAVDAVVADTALPPLVRQQLAAKLREVEWALLHIQTTGYTGVEEALDSLLGGVFRQSGPVEAAPETKNWLVRVVNAIQTAVTGIKEVEAGVQSGAAILDALQQLPPP
jgi:hypothetical protein